MVQYVWITQGFPVLVSRFQVLDLLQRGERVFKLVPIKDKDELMVKGPKGKAG